MLVGIAGENLASSVPEFVGERCEQFALGLQKFAPNRQLAREPEIVFQKGPARRPEKSGSVLQNLRGTRVFERKL